MMRYLPTCQNRNEHHRPNRKHFAKPFEAMRAAGSGVTRTFLASRLERPARNGRQVFDYSLEAMASMGFIPVPKRAMLSRFAFSAL